jgi:hypothetical protein
MITNKKFKTTIKYPSSRIKLIRYECNRDIPPVKYKIYKNGVDTDKFVSIEAIIHLKYYYICHDSQDLNMRFEYKKAFIDDGFSDSEADMIVKLMKDMKFMVNI